MPSDRLDACTRRGMTERVRNTFLMVSVFPLIAVPLYAAAVILLGGRGIIASTIVCYAAAVCMAVLPPSPRFTPRMVEVMAVSCIALLGLFSVHLTAASIDVSDFSSFFTKAANLPLFILSVMGSAAYMAGAAAGYFALLQIVPKRDRWAQWVSLPLLAYAAVLSLRETSSLVAAQGIPVDFTAAVWASPYDLLAWIFLFLLLTYRINARHILRRRENAGS